LVDEGPTTAGSIVAKLKMAFEEWNADKQRVKADAAELGALNPTIKVDSKVDETLANLKKVEAAAVATGRSQANAQVQVGVAQARARQTANELAAAQNKLVAVQASTGSSDLQLAAAQDVLNRATVNHEKSVNRLTAATAELAAIEAVEAGAEEKATAERVKANEANSTSASRVGLIASAVALLVPMLVPLAAFSVGAAGALTLMGAAGVLAILGIRSEMAAGTAAGNQYSAGIQMVKGDLNELSQTAAVGMLKSFLGTVGLINQSMPELNEDVRIFSRMLGQSGGNLLTGTLNGVRILQPLLYTVGQYVDALTLKFARWTSGGGLQRFGDYAMRVLPQVEGLLGSLGTAVFQLLTALSDLGLEGFNVLSVVLNAIHALSDSGALPAVIAGVTAGVIAFKAWGFVAPLLSSVATAMGAVGVATEIATGPIGWIVAGVGALVAVLGLVAVQASTAANAVDSYTAAVQQDNGVIGENVRLQAAKNLQDSGAIVNAQKLGIETDKLVKAALGNKDASAEVSMALNKQTGFVAGLTDTQNAWLQGSKKMTDAQRNQLNAAEDLQRQIDSQAGAVKSAIGAYNDLQKALGGTTISTKAQLAAEQANADAAGVSLSMYLQATAAQKKTADQTALTTATMYLQNDAAGLLKQSLDLLNGKTLNAAQAQNTFDSQIANMGAHIDKTGKAVDRATASLTNHSAAAVANQGELISATQAAEQNAQAFRDAGGSVEDTKQKLIDMKKAIVDHAVSLGEDRGEVQAFIDKIYQIPVSIPPTKIEVDTADAMKKIQDLLAALNAAPAAARTSVGVDVSKANPFTLKPKGSATGETFVSGPGTSTSDSVMRRLSVGEAVIKASSASYNRPFVAAYNQNPERALAGVAASGGSVSVSIVNKAGAALSDLIELHIQRNGQRQQVDLSTGLQRAAV
jgi:hypothetical protein